MQWSQNNSSPCGGSLAASKDSTSTSISCWFGYVLAWGYFRAALKWAAGLPEADEDRWIYSARVNEIHGPFLWLSVRHHPNNKSFVFKSWLRVLKSYVTDKIAWDLIWLMFAHLGQVLVVCFICHASSLVNCLSLKNSENSHCTLVLPKKGIVCNWNSFSLQLSQSHKNWFNNCETIYRMNCVCSYSTKTKNEALHSRLPGDMKLRSLGSVLTLKSEVLNMYIMWKTASRLRVSQYTGIDDNEVILKT